MKRLAICLVMAAVGFGCTDRPTKSHVREISKWHHQIVVADRVALEGYVLHVLDSSSGEKIIMAIGHHYSCDGGLGQKLVLDRHLTIVAVERGSTVALVKWANASNSDVRESDRLDIDARFAMLKERLPMLFDAGDCRRE